MNSQSFLSLVAQDLFARKKGDLKDLVVIFPNRRSGWAFRQELQKLVVKPTWAPRIHSIDDWLISLSGMTEADNLTQLVLLYKSVQNHYAETGSFSSFLDLGEVLLRDFDDIDKYLVDPRAIFRAVGEFKNLEFLFGDKEEEDLRKRLEIFLQTFGQETSVHQKKWLEIWNRLSEIYTDFHRSLEALQVATSGWMYRKVVSMVQSGKAGPFPKDSVVFVGFNILTRAEEAVFLELKSKGVASFYWDYHPSYLTKFHEAGRFIRKYLEEFPCPSAFNPFPDGSSSFFNSDSQDRLRILPMTSNTSQVQYLVNHDWTVGQGHHLIVLSDENLMPDLAAAWKTDHGKVNFTTGFPVIATSPASLLRSYLKIWNDADHNSGGVDHHLLQDLTRHPLFLSLDDETRETFTKRISRKDFQPGDWISGFNELITLILQQGNTLGKLDHEALERIRKEAERVMDLLDHLGMEIDGKGLRHLISGFLSTAKIQLQADYQAPILVAGILETRLLDFDTITILSFNEGIWPSKSLPGTLVPYSLRRYFGLPTAENRDAMYAYYFYRLIQRAGSVTLLHLTGQMDDGIRVSEKSRYIRQLEFDSDLPLIYGRENPAKIVSGNRSLKIEKNEMVLKAMEAFFQGEKGKSLSASALNDYLDCPLRFGLTYVYGLREPDDQDSPSDPKGFGKLIHQGLENLYQSFVNGTRNTSASSFQELLKDEKLLDTALRPLGHGGKGTAAYTGKDDIALLVAREFIISVLEKDMEDPPERIVGLEKTIVFPYGLNRDGFHGSLRLKAVIDRIDNYNGYTRVVDYKTGKCELNFTGIPELFETSATQRKKEVFQVLFYSELIESLGMAESDIMPSIYPVIELRSGNRETRVTLKSEPLVYSAVREEFKAMLANLLSEIFDPSVPFRQTSIDNHCRLCPFSGICMKS